MDRGAWRATVHGVAKESDLTEQLTHTQQLQNSLAFPSLPPAIGLFTENVLFFTILFLLRISLSRYTEKLPCFKDAQNSSSLMNVYATS